MAIRVGDGGGDGCTPVSTYIGLVGGKTKVMSRGVSVIADCAVSYESFGASLSSTEEGSSLFSGWLSMLSPRMRLAFSSGYMDWRDS
jgi:hypothetical protein